MSGVPVWGTELATQRAREAYRYLARTYAPGASLEPLDAYQDAVLDAQSTGDFPAYEEALREMMRAAKREALRRGAV